MPLLSPKRVKYRRMHRGRRSGKASGGTRLNFGDFGLVALESCWMTANQIESARIAITRKIKRGGKVWIRVFPDKSYTKKPAETRMGSGKGAPEGWVAVVKPGRVLFEMNGVAEDLAKEAMRLASHKLPIKTKFITRRDEAAALGGKVATDEDEQIAGRVGIQVTPDAPKEATQVPGDDSTVQENDSRAQAEGQNP